MHASNPDDCLRNPVDPITDRRQCGFKLKRPVVARTATISDWPLILIDLATEEGIVGRSYLEPYIVTSMQYLILALQDLGDLLKGHRIAPIELH